MGYTVSRRSDFHIHLYTTICYSYDKGNFSTMTQNEYMTHTKPMELIFCVVFLSKHHKFPLLW